MVHILYSSTASTYQEIIRFNSISRNCRKQYQQQRHHRTGQTIPEVARALQLQHQCPHHYLQHQHTSKSQMRGFVLFHILCILAMSNTSGESPNDNGHEPSQPSSTPTSRRTTSFFVVSPPDPHNTAAFSLVRQHLTTLGTPRSSFNGATNQRIAARSERLERMEAVRSRSER